MVQVTDSAGRSRESGTTRPLRILMTADTVGGVWTYALHLAAGLAVHGTEVHLATMGAAPDAGQRRAADAVAGLHLYESTFRLEWMNAPWTDVTAAGDWLLALEERIAPDVIHLNGYAHGVLPWHAPHLVVGHSCVYSWWRAVHGARPPLGYTRYEAATRSGLAAARAVVAPSRAMLAALRAHYGAVPHGEVIHNGLPPLPDGAWTKEPVVLTVGRLWDEAKNVQTTVRAAERMRWPLYLAGEIRHPDGWHADLGPVTHLGVLAPETLAAWYARAAVFASPARYEPFGLSILEAAMHGCALVLADIPSLRELWGDAALFVPPDDADALAGAVDGLAGDDALRTRYAQKAMVAARRYTLERCTHGYLALYRRLLHAHAAREAL
ncbi:MAG: glycosyltransferase family 4 protein [Gammaproteobacteria bacterium]|nr:glycosyltransferase family 4 protein [Gammaproteobacteria bacterium]